MSVPYLDLAPRWKHPLRLRNPLDYLRLLYWVFFFPQALRWYEENFVATKHQKAKGKDLWHAIMRDIRLRLLVSQALLLVLFPFLFLFLLEYDITVWLLEQTWFPTQFRFLIENQIITFIADLNVTDAFSLVIFSTTTGVLLGVAYGVARGVARGVSTGVSLAISLGVVSIAFLIIGGYLNDLFWTSQVISSSYRDFLLLLVFFAGGGVVFGLVKSVSASVEGGMALDLARGVTVVVVSSFSWSVLVANAAGDEIFNYVAYLGEGFVILVATIGIAFLRPVGWAMGVLNFASISFPISLRGCTPLPLPGLKGRLTKWLREDWTAGVHNLNELLSYSLQFIPVIQALNDAMAEYPQQRLIWAVDEVAKDPYDWNLLRFASAPLLNGLVENAISIPLPKIWKDVLKARYPTDLRLDTPPRAACAGFWYLHEKQPLQAAKAFNAVRELPGGEEMWRLCEALRRAEVADDLSNLADLAELKAFRLATTIPSKSESIFHPFTWQALEHLQRAAQEAHVVRDSSSGAMRSQALNRAIGEVIAVQSLAKTLPSAERALVEEIGEKWQKALLSVASDVGKSKITAPVQNPYVAGNPVVGKGFVGREDIINHLIELWRGKVSMPSVVLFGHRRMGKTSILRNIDSHLDSDVLLAYISLLTLGDAPGGVSDLFLAMADKIREVLPRFVFTWDEVPGTDNERLKDFLAKEFEISWLKDAKIEKLDNDTTIKVFTEKEVLSMKLEDERTKGVMKIYDGRTIRFIIKIENGKMNLYFPGYPKSDETSFDRHPYRAFEKFLRETRSDLASSRLIIALDEFEQLEEWMRGGRIPRDLLKVLRSYVQMDEHIAFAFAGLHTLEEMTSDYFEPFFASVVSIRISFLSHNATFQVLANPPLEDFPLGYEPEALERIWQLTGGQPYLVQLVGHHLVSRFNRMTFEKDKPQGQIFKVSDVEAVVEDPEFYSQGRYYFTGVWGQAGQGTTGQQDALRELASFPEGLPWEKLLDNYGPRSSELKAALDELQRHDVLIEKENRWKFTVELLRRWVKDFGDVRQAIQDKTAIRRDA